MSGVMDRVAALTGVQDQASAENITRAVSSTLCEELSLQDRTWFTHLLPSALVEPATSPSRAPAESAMRFYARVAEREDVELGFAIEHAQCVCRALAETLREDELHHLASRLAPEIAALLSVTEPAAPELIRDRPRPTRHTLAEGSPGSRRPLSEAAPERAQGESVARSDNPHGDTKLSSTAGTTQEREAETLAQNQDAHEADTLAGYRPARGA
jgi:uncharacterized protein (DUF2267 family)